MRRLAKPWAVLCLAAAPLAAQWASNPGSGAAVTTTGFMVLHDDGASLRAFSAFTKTWRTIAPTGSTLVGAGDFAALVQLPSGEYRAYSARTNATENLVAGAGMTVIDIRVEDDVVLVLRDTGTTPPVLAAAYSAQTNAWAAIELDSIPIVATSRFVVALKDDLANFVHGFGARRAFWQTLGFYDCGAPIADGNVAAVMHTGASGLDQALVFSGITNAWAFSPDVTPGSPLQIDHDVAHVLVGQAGGGAPCGFSAYTGEWITSPNLSPIGDYLGVTLRDKLILVQRAPASAQPEFEAIGALPHGGWAAIAGANLALLGMAEDAVVLVRPLTGQLEAFGGLCGGGWMARATAGAPVFEGTPEHGCLVRDAIDQFHAFSPAHGAWAPALALAGANARVGDCVAIVEAGLAAYAWSARHNAWIAAPALAMGATLAYAVEGSAAARQVFPAGGASVLDAFDERSGAWKSIPLGLASPAAVGLVRNALVLTGGGVVRGFSAQRSDLFAAAGVAFPVASLAVDENVAVVRDAGGILHAFGSPADGHAFYQWPLDTETHAFPRLFAPTQLCRFAVRAPSGSIGILAVAAAPYFPGVVIAGLGVLYLVPPAIIVKLGGTAGANGVAQVVLSILAPGGGACIEIYGQGAAFDPVVGTPALVGNVPEPIRIF